MPRPLSSLVALLAVAALAACPSKPPKASVIEVDGSVPPIDTPVEDSDGMPPIDGPGVIEIGFPDPLPGTKAVGNNELVGFPIQVAAGQAGKLVGWGVKSASGPAGTQVRMALYSNSGTDPAALLFQSGNWNLADGMVMTPEVSLGAGNYWLVISVSNMISIGRSTASVPESRECLRSLMFTIALPSTWSSGTCFAENPINIFIRVRPSA